MGNNCKAALITALFFVSTTALANVSVTGSTGTPNVEPFLSIGTGGSAGTMLINNGSVVTSGDGAAVGLDLGSAGSVRITDPGSRWDVGGIAGSIFFLGPSFTPGVQGGTGSILVENSATLSASSFDAGSEFGDARFFVGVGGNGSLHVRSGGTANVTDLNGFGSDDGVQIGNSTTDGLAGNGSVLIEGTGSSLSLIHI